MKSTFFLFSCQAISQGMRVILFLIFIFNSPITAGTNLDIISKNQSFYFQFLTFQSQQQEKTLLEIFCQIPSRNYQQLNIENDNLALFEIVVTLNDLNYVQIAKLSFIDSLKTETVESLSNLNMPNLVRFTFFVEPGEYMADVKMIEKYSQKCVSFEKTLYIADYSNNDLSISDLQIASSISWTDEESILVKNNRKILPNVSHVFGMRYDKLYVYAEIYNLLISKNESINTFSTKISIVDTYGRVVKKVTNKYDKPGNVCILSFKIPTDDLQSGMYKIKLDVEDLDSNQRASNYAVFTVARPYSRYSDEEYTNLLNQLKYVASTQDIENLKSLPKQERSEGLKRLWEKLDPTPGTETNEFMLEYYRRVSYANEHFNSVKGHGWETDQGKIYIKEGSPDKIAHVPSFLDNKIYEIWEYHKPNQRYVFVDELGLGQFKLFRALKNSSKELTLFQ